MLEVPEQVADSDLVKNPRWSQAKVERSPPKRSSNKVGGYTISSLASAYVDGNADLTSSTAGGLELTAKDVDMFLHVTSFDHRICFSNSDMHQSRKCAYPQKEINYQGQ
jgi:hypothetical protein